MKKLVAMLIALCLVCGTGMAEDVFVKTSQFVILKGSALFDYFKVTVKESKNTNDSNPIVVEGKSTMMNQYFKISVFKYTDDVEMLGVSVSDDLLNAKEAFAGGTLSSQVYEKWLCNLSYHVALAKTDLGKYDENELSYHAYGYYGGYKSIFMGHTAKKEGILYATCHNDIFDMAYIFEIGRINTSKGAQLDNEVLLTMLLQNMTDIAAPSADDQEEQQKENQTGQYVIITNSSANIRSGPDGSAAKLITAKQGDTFPLIGEDGNWYIIDVNGQTGYVTKSLSAIQ